MSRGRAIRRCRRNACRRRAYPRDAGASRASRIFRGSIRSRGATPREIALPCPVSPSTNRPRRTWFRSAFFLPELAIAVAPFLLAGGEEPVRAAAVDRFVIIAGVGGAARGVDQHRPLVRAAIMRLARPCHDLSFIRSEEHTSELQSLMRIPYAVFCLKKK